MRGFRGGGGEGERTFGRHVRRISRYIIYNNSTTMYRVLECCAETLRTFRLLLFPFVVLDGAVLSLFKEIKGIRVNCTSFFSLNCADKMNERHSCYSAMNVLAGKAPEAEKLGPSYCVALPHNKYRRYQQRGLAIRQMPNHFLCKVVAAASPAEEEIWPSVP